ncbi:MAG: cadherin-like domain-containing protein, partial [Verrucomicrobiales bacterium]
MILAEGATVLLGTGDLLATDPDNAAADLSFTPSGVTHGQFLVGGSPATTFTQEQIIAGAVSFQHDGGETAPAYAITVSDGALNDGPHPAAITFGNINDAPQIIARQVTLSEGETLLLTAANIGASDPDNGDAELTFTPSVVVHGQFLVGGSPAATFTQAQVLAGQVSFQHGGGELAPGYDISVGDGTDSTTPSAAAIDFTGINDPPAIAANALAIDEGGTVVLGISEIAASDPDTADADLIFTASNVGHGQFLSGGSPTLTFTQAQIIAGEVSFEHDGGEAAPSFDLAVSDGSLSDGPAAAAITFTNINDAPELTANALAIGEGASVVLSAANLAATDIDDAEAALLFTASAIGGGQFLVGGSPATTFTQEQ